MTFRREDLADGIVVYNADCRDVLPTLGKVDAVVTDPPYGVGFRGSVTKFSKRDGNSYTSFEDTPENVTGICVPVVRQAAALARSAAVTPGNRCSHLYDAPAEQGVIWYPGGANAGPWGFTCSQPIFYYGRDPYLMRGLGSRPNGFASGEVAEQNGHPCPKPLRQTEWLVNRVSFDGETVLDPFMGSGTTGVACVRLGRRFIGIEIEPRYFDIACRRIADELRRPRLALDVPPKPTQEALGI